MVLLTLGKMEDKSSGPRVDGPEEKGTAGWLIALEANRFAGLGVLLTLLLLLLLLLFVMLEEGRALLLLAVVLARLGRCDAADAFLLGLFRSFAGDPVNRSMAFGSVSQIMLSIALGVGKGE